MKHCHTGFGLGIVVFNFYQGSSLISIVHVTLILNVVVISGIFRLSSILGIISAVVTSSMSGSGAEEELNSSDRKAGSPVATCPHGPMFSRLSVTCRQDVVKQKIARQNYFSPQKQKP